MYRLVALDVDGTLLNDRHQLPAWNKEVLQILIEKGVYVTLATGKSFITVKDLISDLGLLTPQITNDGALIVDPIARKTIMELRCPIPLAIEVVKLTKSLGATTVLVNETGILAENHNLDTQYMESFGDPHPMIVDRLENAMRFRPTHVMVITFGNDELYEKVYNTLRTFFGSKLNVLKSSPYFIEVLNPKASKGNALSFLMEYLGIEKPETVCFGDSLNDLSMFEAVGYNVAMGNAKSDLKKVANLIADTHNNYGVAKALVKLFKINSLTNERDIQ